MSTTICRIMAKKEKKKKKDTSSTCVKNIKLGVIRTHACDSYWERG
jgi:hypothetical protein